MSSIARGAGLLAVAALLVLGLTLLLVAGISALPRSRALTKLTPWPTS